MTAAAKATPFDIKLPASLAAERRGEVAVLRLARPEKRNALNDPTVHGLGAFFDALPQDIKAVVIHGEGEHFSAGLDLSELTERSVIEGVMHSDSWHHIFQRIQFGRVPVVAVLHGAVVGGGLELAASCHVRVAERSAYYALPEGSRGIFVGGGGSVRLPPLIGTAAMMDMMLTGHVLDAEEGKALGISQYLVDTGEGLAKGLALAERIAGNTALTNYAILQALPRIARSDPDAGLFAEALVAGIVQDDEEAKNRLRAFLEKRAPKVVRS